MSPCIGYIVDPPDQTIGYRGVGYVKGAKISTDQDVAGIIQSEVINGLRKKGFDPVSNSQETQRSLKVEIRLIEYSTSTGLWTAGVETKAALKAIAKNKDKNYENLYRVGNEKRIMVTPTANSNAKLINNLVAQVLEKFLLSYKF